MNPEEQQLRLYEGVGSVVHNICQLKPMVMFLDDLHLAAQMNLQLHIARSLSECRLLIVYAFREDELNERPALVASRNELIRSRLVADIRLSPLTEEETGRMIAHAFGEAAAATLQAPVYAVNKGNPFSLEEVLQYLVENNAVRKVDDHWEVLDNTRVGIPESVKHLLHERAARLGEDVNAALQQAAVMGMEFSFAALAAMSDQTEEQIVESLDQGMAAGFLIDLTGAATEERYSFKEDHIREVLYENILAARRRRYHLRAGQVLNELYPHRLDELAYHFTHGSDIDKGATFSYRAAERESSLFNWTRAIPLYQDALDLWDESGGHLEERAAVAEKLGDASYKFGIEASRARGFLRQALQFNQELGDQHKVATVHSQLGREYLHSGNLSIQDLDLAMEHFNLAKDVFDSEDDGVPQGMVYCGLAMASQDRLELTDAIHWASRGRNSLERAWETAHENGLGFQADLSRALAARALGVALKNPTAGFAWIDREPDYRTTYSLFDIPSHSVALHALRGDFEEASLVLEELQNSLRALHQPVFGLWPDELAMLRIRRGTLDTAEARLLEAVDWAGNAKNRFAEATAMQKLGEVYLAWTQWDKAVPYLEQASEIYKESGSTVSQLGLLSHICEGYIRTGQPEKASAHLAQTMRITRDLDAWEGLQGDLFLGQGMVGAASGRWADADTAFASAIGTYKEYGLPWDEAKVYYEWASGIQDDGGNSGHPAVKATELFGKALSIWEPMGADSFAELCRAKLT